MKSNEEPTKIGYFEDMTYMILTQPPLRVPTLARRSQRLAQELIELGSIQCPITIILTSVLLSAPSLPRPLDYLAHQSKYPSSLFEMYDSIALVLMPLQ